MPILFLSDFPNADNLKGGMMQRVAAVDMFFESTSRKYLACSLSGNFKKTTAYPAENVVYEKVNLILHCVTIIKEIRSGYSTIYIHSIFNCLPLFTYFQLLKKSLKNKTLILDVHGIVPEELKFYERRLAYYLFKRVESWAFKTINKAIFVTHKMKSYLLLKYPAFKGDVLVYNIYPKSIDVKDVKSDVLKGIDTKKNIVIYSGNSQKWQNIDLMLDTIKRNISDKIEYVILTGEKKLFEKNLIQKELIQHVRLLSLTTDELAEIYKIASYGFILRTDMPINMVANPTKLVEYLHFGITPIVLSEKIGDFIDMGYEYVNVQSFSDKLPKTKSAINIKIANELESSNLQANLFSFVSRDGKL